MTKINFTEGQIIYLSPEEIPPHPVIEKLERYQAFELVEEKVNDLIKSFSEIGILEPIVITVENGIPYRVAGRHRQLAAQRMGLGTIPCYVRIFTSEEEVISAWFEENYTRKQHTPAEKIQKVEKVKEILAPTNVETLKKIKELLNDDTLFDIIKEMPANFQSKFLQILQKPPKEVVKIVTEIPKEMEQQILRLQRQIQEKEMETEKWKAEKNSMLEQIKNLQTRINEIRSEISSETEEKIKQKYEQIIQNLQERDTVLTKKVKDLESQIAEKEREKMKLYEELSETTNAAKASISSVSRILLQSLNEMIANQLKIFESQYLPYIESRETIIVLLDYIEKMQKLLGNKLSEITEILKSKIA